MGQHCQTAAWQVRICDATVHTLQWCWIVRCGRAWQAVAPALASVQAKVTCRNTATSVLLVKLCLGPACACPAGHVHCPAPGRSLLRTPAQHSPGQDRCRCACARAGNVCHGCCFTQKLDVMCFHVCRTDNAVKNHWNSTLKRRRAEYAPGGPLDVSAITAALQRRLACAGADDGACAWVSVARWGACFLSKGRSLCCAGWHASRCTETTPWVRVWGQHKVRTGRRYKWRKGMHGHY
jgi:hypothetical protein